MTFHLRQFFVSSGLYAFASGSLFVAATCGQTPTPPAQINNTEYVTQAMDLMEQYSLHKKEVDWADLRANVLGRIRGDTQPNARYDAIRYALALLHDHHGHILMPPTTEADLVARGAGVSVMESYISPEGRIEQTASGAVAVVVIPQYLSDKHAKEFATNIQALLRKLDAKKPVGWIVDLRGNGGGNMWPMLAGIGPLLGTGEAGGFLNADGVRQIFSYDNGQAIMNDRPGHRAAWAQTIGEPYEFSLQPPVAVLIDQHTASSGETIAIAFRGRPMTRFFGTHTRGVSTGTIGHRLSDGATLVLEQAVNVDRNGTVYKNGVEPDVIISAGVADPHLADDPVLKAAGDWLLKEYAK
jgi:carboxyl-terminal processing protease